MSAVELTDAELEAERIYNAEHVFTGDPPYGEAAQRFYDEEATVRRGDIPTTTRARWDGELEAERALDAAQAEAERSELAKAAADELATVKMQYLKARANVEKLLPELDAVMTKTAELRMRYEQKWVTCAGLEVQDERIPPLAIGEQVRTIMSLGGRL
jgi:hypothetical protein